MWFLSNYANENCFKNHNYHFERFLIMKISQNFVQMHFSTQKTLENMSKRNG